MANVEDSEAGGVSISSLLLGLAFFCVIYYLAIKDGVAGFVKFAAGIVALMILLAIFK